MGIATRYHVIAECKHTGLASGCGAIESAGCTVGIQEGVYLNINQAHAFDNHRACDRHLTVSRTGRVKYWSE